MTARLTTASYLVLGLVDLLGEASPYALKQAAADYVAPFWSLPHTQIYVQADKLVEAGLLAQEQESGGRRRRLLTITDDGKKALSEWLADPAVIPVEARDLGLLKLFFGSDVRDIGPAQISHHTERLQGYEQMKAESAGMPRGPAATLAFGIRYEQALVAFWSTLLDRRSGTNAADGQDVS
ncbi:PadR family transcriptional regulator [Luteipulveratus halotolerans]|uniref:PadR family transcriptional regulator n=1 Tax=Luteipulveratus halotolerans TaxID=1631356 RepID=A0A0L6CHR2_9MICO|nr:helix-turn-helix transcriptional regulator [Luteipulveratus halotolerans]KNX37337.1 hypothetical protein VV01_09545 [Luteipulveratus halotolerans]